MQSLPKGLPRDGQRRAYLVARKLVHFAQDHGSRDSRRKLVKAIEQDSPELFLLHPHGRIIAPSRRNRRPVASLVEEPHGLLRRSILGTAIARRAADAIYDLALENTDKPRSLG